MEEFKFAKWMPVKVKRKSDGKIILAVCQERMYNSIMLWDGEHQWLVKPGEDEFSIPTPEEAATINKNVNKWRENLYNPTPSFKVTETKVEKPSKVTTLLDAAKKVVDSLKETPKPQPKVLSDFELLTADIASL